MKRAVCSESAADSLTAKTRKLIEVQPVKMIDEIVHLI